MNPFKSDLTRFKKVRVLTHRDTKISSVESSLNRKDVQNRDDGAQPDLDSIYNH